MNGPGANSHSAGKSSLDHDPSLLWIANQKKIARLPVNGAEEPAKLPVVPPPPPPPPPSSSSFQQHRDHGYSQGRQAPPQHSSSSAASQHQNYNHPPPVSSNQRDRGNHQYDFGDRGGGNGQLQPWMQSSRGGGSGSDNQFQQQQQHQQQQSWKQPPSSSRTGWEHDNRSSLSRTDWQNDNRSRPPPPQPHYQPSSRDAAQPPPPSSSSSFSLASSQGADWERSSTRPPASFEPREQAFAPRSTNNGWDAPKSHAVASTNGPRIRTPQLGLAGAGGTTRDFFRTPLGEYRIGPGPAEDAPPPPSSSSRGGPPLMRDNPSQFTSYSANSNKILSRRLSPEEREILRLAHLYNRKGFDIPKYTIHDDFDQIYFDVNRIQTTLDVEQFVKAKKDKWLMGATMLEFVLKLLPLGIPGDEIKKDVEQVLNDNVMVLEKQYLHMGQPTPSYSDKELLVALSGAIMARILTNYNRKKDSTTAAKNAAAANSSSAATGNHAAAAPGQGAYPYPYPYSPPYAP